MTVKLGQRGRDIITGFEGVCMAHAQYLTGCSQILIVPTTLDEKGDRREGDWFDDARIELCDAAAVVLLDAAAPVAHPGADERSAPKR